MDVGIRELKAHLSEYLGRAAGGEDIVVTDRGTPIVRLVAARPTGRLEQGYDEGWAEPPRRTRLEPVDRVRSSHRVLDVLDEDRG